VERKCRSGLKDEERWGIGRDWAWWLLDTYRARGNFNGCMQLSYIIYMSWF
jgi:hypothetical protein